jgi:hypothetical protein
MKTNKQIEYNENKKQNDSMDAFGNDVGLINDFVHFVKTFVLFVVKKIKPQRTQGMHKGHSKTKELIKRYRY